MLAQLELQQVLQTADGNQDTDEIRAVFSAVGVLRVLRLQQDSPEEWAQLRHLQTQIENIRRDKMAAAILDNAVSYLDRLGYTREQVEKAFGLIKINR
jgi:Holliday junction resolvasome RuvABC DNA-binding subunit